MSLSNSSLAELYRAIRWQQLSGVEEGVVIPVEFLENLLYQEIEKYGMPADQVDQDRIEDVVDGFTTDRDPYVRYVAEEDGYRLTRLGNMVMDQWLSRQIPEEGTRTVTSGHLLRTGGIAVAGRHRRARRRRGADGGPELVFYHATRRAYLPSILEHGLDPDRRQLGFGSRGSWIYLGIDRGQIATYSHVMPDGDGIVLRVDGRFLDPALLGPDDDDLTDILRQLEREDDNPWEGMTWRDVSWEDSLMLTGQVTYSGVIPPEAITIAGERTIGRPRQPIPS